MSAQDPQALRAMLEAQLDAVQTRLMRFSSTSQVTSDCLGFLTQARAELAIDHFEDARALMLQASYRVEQAQQSDDTLHRWGWRIGIYEGCLLLGFVALLVFGGRSISWLNTWSQDGHVYLAPYCLWGGLGGVVAALFGLYLHSAQRDFDAGYIAYYFLKPVVGLALGPLMYLFGRAGLVAVEAGAPSIARPELLYLGAFILGFGERFALRLIDRIATAIFGPNQPAGGAAAASRPPAGLPPAPGAPGGGGPCPSPPGTGVLRVEIDGVTPDDVHDVSATLSKDGVDLKVEGPPPNDGTAFVFTGLPPGTYSVQVSKQEEGWRQAEATPGTAVLESPGESKTVRVTLEQAPQEEEPGPPAPDGG